MRLSLPFRCQELGQHFAAQIANSEQQVLCNMTRTAVINNFNFYFNKQSKFFVQDSGYLILFNTSDNKTCCQQKVSCYQF